jgi:hypothetical protein
VSCQAYGERYQCLHGLAGDQTPKAWESIVFDMLLLELVGHVASCEGIIRAVQQCARYSFLSSVSCVVPRFLETWAVPVDLSRAKRLSIECLGNDFALVHKFPIETTKLSPPHIERYDLLEVLRSPVSSYDQMREHVWQLGGN